MTDNYPGYEIDKFESEGGTCCQRCSDDCCNSELQMDKVEVLGRIDKRPEARDALHTPKDRY